MVTDMKSFHFVEGWETRIKQVNEVSGEDLRIIIACGSGGGSRRPGAEGRSAGWRGVSSDTHSD